MKLSTFCWQTLLIPHFWYETIKSSFRMCKREELSSSFRFQLIKFCSAGCYFSTLPGCTTRSLPAVGGARSKTATVASAAKVTVCRASQNVGMSQWHTPLSCLHHVTSQLPLGECPVGSAASFSSKPQHLIPQEQEESPSDTGWSCPQVSRRTAALTEAITSGITWTTA